MHAAREFHSLGTCRCHASAFEVRGKVLTRFLCHCTICQTIYKAPFVDVSVFWAGAVRVTTPDSVGYKRYRLAPAVTRGTCRSCGDPVVGFMTVAPLMRIAYEDFLLDIGLGRTSRRVGQPTWRARLASRPPSGGCRARH